MYFVLYKTQRVASALLTSLSMFFPIMGALGVWARGQRAPQEPFLCFSRIEGRPACCINGSTLV